MIRAKLFADEKKAFEIDEEDEEVLIEIHSAIEAARLIGLFVAIRKYGEATGWEEKSVRVKYGFLEFGI